jgi:hypothetical protein
MSRHAARFTQADIARALKAVEQVGARMAVEILPDGTIRIAPVVEKNNNQYNMLNECLDNRPIIPL